MAETLRVGIAGLGTVGAETFRILSERKDILLSRSGKKIEVVAVSSQDRHIDRGIDLSGVEWVDDARKLCFCLLYTSPSPRDGLLSRMPSSA